MPLSMTGCGEGAATDGANSCRIELRTVNNRFFKLSLRTREGLNAIEGQIEAAIRKRVRRGTVQMALDIAGPLAPGLRRLDLRQLEAYLHDRERILEVTTLIVKRVGAAVAVDCFVDHSAPVPEREVDVPVFQRDRGAGRPTKRDRRELDRLRGRRR